MAMFLIPFDPITYFFIGKIIIEYLIITAIYNVFIRLTRTFIYININGKVMKIALND